MELSKRLQAVANLVTEGASVADIGTDHGYIPIYLVENGRVKRAIAMDVNTGPLERAREHIRKEQLEESIETRLSDGMQALKLGEVDEIITAGMGGGLVIKILTDYPEITNSLKVGILQPQSEIQKVRDFLNKQGYRIVAEDFVKEDGKYYPMMKVDFRAGSSEEYKMYEYLYGKRLLEEKNPVLLEYLEKEMRIKSDIVEKLSFKLRIDEDARIQRRITEVQEELRWIDEALAVYKTSKNSEGCKKC